MADQPSREEQILNAVLQFATREERAACLKVACAGDPALLQRVETLLQAQDQTGDSPDPDVTVKSFPSTDLPVVEPLTEKPGDRIGRYKLLQEIGEGGMGSVWMAEQEEPVRRRVALKVVKLGMDTKQVVGRFEAERQALALMDHSNIAKVFDAGATDTGRPFFVMELVRGVPITEYCDQNNLSTQQRLDLFIPVCQAIQHAHQKGIIHRDIKPSNILVTLHDGVPVPKVIDFGIAKAIDQPLTEKTLFTRFEQFMGTPAYMSPEQAEMSGLDIDTRSDIYSLGVLLYELLTGKTPFDSGELVKSGVDGMRKTIREQEPERPSSKVATLPGEELTTTAKRRSTDTSKLMHQLHGDLDWIVMNCLEKDRTRRYETANGLATDVRRYLDNEPVVARPPSAGYRFQKLVRRNRLAFAAASAVAGALIIGLGLSTWLFLKEKEARQRAVAAERVQSQLRLEAENARQNEVGLRRQAEADERKARTEASKSRQVAQFLENMLQGIGPSVALGRDTTMLHEILDKTAARVGKDLTDQPAVQAELLDTIGAVYTQLGKFEQAEAKHREALALRRKLFGNENPDVATSLHNLADALYFQHYEGKLAEAETSERQALAIYRKELGDEHQSVVSSLHRLAAILSEEGKMAEAETIYREELAIREKLPGVEQPEVAWSLCGLGYVLQSQGKLAEAEALYRKALTMQIKLLGNEHPDIAWSLFDLGRVLQEQGKLAEAETIHREALAMRRKLLGGERPEVFRSLDGLADVLRDEGKPIEAETMYREALAIRRKLPGDEHPDVAESLGKLATVLSNEGKFTDAETLVRECLAIYEKQLPDDWRTFDARSMLGGSLLGQKKFTEAEPLLLSGYEGLKQRENKITLGDTTPRFWSFPADEKPWLKEAAKRLVELYEETGRPDEAAEWRKTLDATTIP